MGRNLLDVIDTLARTIAMLTNEMKGSAWRGSIEEAWKCGQGSQGEDEYVVTPPTSSTRHSCAQFWPMITATLREFLLRRCRYCMHSSFMLESWEGWRADADYPHRNDKAHVAVVLAI